MKAFIGIVVFLVAAATAANNEFCYRDVDRACKQTGSKDFVAIGTKAGSRFMLLCERLHQITTEISTQFLELLPSTINNANITGSQVGFPNVTFPSSYVHPNWEELYYDMHLLLGVLFPNMNNSLHFIGSLKKNLRNIHEIKARGVMEQVNRIKDISNCSKITNVLDTIPLEYVGQIVANVSLKIEDFITHSLFERRKNSHFQKTSTWIFLFPSIYGFVVFFFFTAGVIGTCREIQTNLHGRISSGIYTIKCFKIAIRISIAFLWLILLLAGILYFAHIPLVVICGTIQKDIIIDRYLDRPYWKNGTWLMSKMNMSAINVTGPLNLKYFLSECGKNKTILRSLSLEEYLGKKYCTNLNQLIQQVKKESSDIIRKQGVTDFENVIHYLNYVDYYHLDIKPLSQIEDDLERVNAAVDVVWERASRNNSTQIPLRKSIKSAKQVMMEMKVFVADMVQSKFLVKCVKEQMVQLQYLNYKLKNIIKNDLYRDINEYLNNVTSYVKCIYEDTEHFIKKSLLNDFGDCSYLPYAFNKLRWIVCDYGLEVMLLRTANES